MNCSASHVLSFAATLSLVLPLSSQAPTTLVVLPPSLTYARAVSADGLTVVGTGSAQVARWTAAGGLLLLGTVPGDTGASALAVNSDGSVLVGWSDNSWWGTTQAMQHVGGSNAVSLGTLAGATHSMANDVNLDGTIVVGDASGGAFLQTAVRWHVGVITQLASLDPTQNCWATGVDASGWAIAGTSYVSSIGPQQQHAVRWFLGVIADLGALPGRTSSEALAISDDGLVVVGNSWNTSINGGHLNERAFRWVSNSSGGAMQDLGLPRSSMSARIHCLSADGRVAGGAAYYSGQGYVAALWTAARGWIDLGYLLAQLNVNLGGAQLTEVVSLTADGTTLLCSTATGGYVLLQNLPLGGFLKRATGCGDLELDHWGLPRPGGTLGFGLWNGLGYRGLVAGTPANTPLPQCPGCTAGVSGVTTAESISLQVPNHPSMIGVQLAFQGFDIGTGPCFGAVRLSDTVDVTIQ